MRPVIVRLFKGFIHVDRSIHSNIDVYKSLYCCQDIRTCLLNRMSVFHKRVRIININHTPLTYFTICVQT